MRTKKQQTPRREQLANALARIDEFRFEARHTDDFAHDRITEANASTFDNSHLSEPLTDYAVDWRDESGLDEALEFFAPETPVGQRYEYREWSNADEFEHDADDERAIGEDFKTVAQTGRIVQDKLANRGLQIFVDEDEVNGDPNWRERKTGKLLRRIKRNALIRAVNLLSAAATNDNLTWDTSAGKDPDQDIETMLAAAGDGSGMDPNRVGYGRTAWLLRKKAHRAQDTAGGIASAMLSPADVAAHLGVDSVFVAKARYGTAATKTRLMGNLVLAFTAHKGLDPEDPSNIKRFFQLLDGQRYRVYEWRVGPKKFCIAVEHYERTRITSTLGIAKRTIS